MHILMMRQCLPALISFRNVQLYRIGFVHWKDAKVHIKHKAMTVNNFASSANNGNVKNVTGATILYQLTLKNM